MEEILHYENITFRREGREILKGVDWHINKGENWALFMCQSTPFKISLPSRLKVKFKR